MCLFLIILLIYTLQITSTESDKPVTNSILDANLVDDKDESSSPKNRVKRAPQSYIVEEQKLLTVVNRVPVRVPVVRVS